MLSKQEIKSFLISPNALTIYRIASVPGIVILLLFPGRLCTFASAMLFTVAAITDFFDGFYARSRGLESSFGKIMDPVADKLLVCLSLIMLSSYGWVPGWIVCIIIGREIAITGFRNFIVESSQDVSASALGKYKTGFQIAAIIPLLIHYPYLGIDFHAIGTLFLWVALLLTLWSGIDYLIKSRKLTNSE